MGVTPGFFITLLGMGSAAAALVLWLVALRLHRRALIAGVWPLLTVATLLLAMAGLDRFLAPYSAAVKPVAWLRMDLRQGRPVQAGHAAAELASRTRSHALSAPQVRSVLDDVLNQLADPVRPWTDPCSDMILAAHLRGWITRPQYERYLSLLIQPSIAVPTTLEPGQPLPVTFDSGIWPLRAPLPDHLFRIDISATGGIDYSVVPNPRFTTALSYARSDGAPPPVQHLLLEELNLEHGPHTLEVLVVSELVDLRTEQVLATHRCRVRASFIVQGRAE